MLLSEDRFRDSLQNIGVTLSPNTDKIERFLTRNLNIGANVVKSCIESGGVAEDEYGSIVFPVFDLVGQLVGAETKTTDNTKRTYIRGSLGDFGYSWIIGDTVRSICYFTNTLDLLAFVDYYTNIDATKPLKDVLLVALHGNHRKKPVKTYSGYYEGVKSTLCLQYNELANKCMPDIPHFYPHTGNGITANSWHELLLSCKKIMAERN